MPPRQPLRSAKAIRLYTANICKKLDSFSCPQCKETLLSKDFEKHCLIQHALNPKLCCVWCQGNTRWPSAQKWKNVEHLLTCWRQFMILNRPKPSSTTPRPFPVSFDLKPMALKRCLFDRILESPPLRAYDPIWPMPLDPNLLTFQDDSLNRAVSCVKKYLQLGNEAADWFHVMVRSVAFPSFLKAMDADEGRSRTLPFSCWCDGGKPSRSSLRQHRHMLIVSSPPGHFVQNVWKKMHIPRDLLPRQNFRCVHLEPILSALHLVNVLGYVSNRRSQCTFSGDHRKAPKRDNHFYLFESLPKDYRLPLVLQWEGGLVQLLNQEFKNLKRGELVRSLLDFVAHQWRFQIKNIPGITLNTVLPVSLDFQPISCSSLPTPYFLNLIGSGKMYFERHPLLNRLTPDNWLKRQADRGNLFHHVVGELHWTPRPYHQGLIREFKPLVDRNRELERKNAHCQGMTERLERENARWKEKTEHLERQWKEKCNALEQEVKRIQGKREELNDEIRQFYKEEITRLKMEYNELRREREELKREIEQLKKCRLMD